MPRPNMLQMYLLLGLFYSFALPLALGAILINPTLAVNPNGSLNETSPVCVNNTQVSTWGLTLEGFDFSDCQHALELMASRLDGDMYTSYDFYSRQVFAAGHEGWPLAQGAGAG